MTPWAQGYLLPFALLVCDALPGCKDIFHPIKLLSCNALPGLKCYDALPERDTISKPSYVI